MKALIYDKTQKGREEIATRVHQLPSRLRSLLVLIDGKQTDLALLKKIPGLGLEGKHLDELLLQGFIQLINNDVEVFSNGSEETVEIEKNEVDLEVVLADTTDNEFSEEEISTVLEESQTIFQTPEQEDIGNINTTPTEMRIQLRLELIRKFLISSIEEYLGLKGFFILRKVKKAKTFEDFHSIRNSFVVAILRKKGKDKAIELRDEFDQLTYSKFSVDFPEFLDD